WRYSCRSKGESQTRLPHQTVCVCLLPHAVAASAVESGTAFRSSETHISTVQDVSDDSIHVLRHTLYARQRRIPGRQMQNHLSMNRLIGAETIRAHLLSLGHFSRRR